MAERELLQRALDALIAMQGSARGMNCGLRICGEAIDAIRAHLAQPPAEPDEPVAWLHQCQKPGTYMEFATVDPEDNSWWPADQWTKHEVLPLYTAPPPVQPPAKPLTEEESIGAIVWRSDSPASTG